MVRGNGLMKYDYIFRDWASKEELKEIYGFQNVPKGAAGVWDRLKRMREEMFSVADLSKLLVDRRAESIIVHGQKLGYLCRTLAEQYHVFVVSANGIAIKEYCFNRRFSMLLSEGVYGRRRTCPYF